VERHYRAVPQGAAGVAAFAAQALSRGLGELAGQASEMQLEALPT
jgi:hypothetical protein